MANLAIHGAAGRMGKRLIALGSQDPDLQLIAAVESAHCSQLGSDAGIVAGVDAIGVDLTDQWPDGIETVIDFSVPEACMRALEYCKAAGVPLVVATTGLNESQVADIRTAAESIPICWAPNMSLAVNLTMKLAEQAATALKDVPQGADVEILERHLAEDQLLRVDLHLDVVFLIGDLAHRSPSFASSRALLQQDRCSAWKQTG